MNLDTKSILPKITLPRYNATKRIWLKPRKFYIEPIRGYYKISFLTRRNTGDFEVSRLLPRKINLNDKFKCALTAYLCEGTQMGKGVFTQSSGQKGKNVSFSNTQPWLIKLVIDDFRKIGIRRDDWRVRLQLYTQHNIGKEKIWWSKELGVPIERIKSIKVSEGDIKRSYRAPHGRAEIGIESVILASVISNLLNLLKKDKL